MTDKMYKHTVYCILNIEYLCEQRHTKISYSQLCLLKTIDKEEEWKGPSPLNRGPPG